MALEDLTGPGKFIGHLVVTNPTPDDWADEGDDHVRGIKNVLRNTFGALDGSAVALSDDGSEVGDATLDSLAHLLVKGLSAWLRFGTIAPDVFTVDAVDALGAGKKMQLSAAALWKVLIDGADAFLVKGDGVTVPGVGGLAWLTFTPSGTGLQAAWAQEGGKLYLRERAGAQDILVIDLTTKQLQAVAGITPAFESPEQALVLGTHTAIAHGLASRPQNVKAFLRCITAEFGYAVGDEIPAPDFYAQASAHYNVTAYATAVNVGFTVGVNAIQVAKRAATVGQVCSLTPAFWRAVLRAW